MGAGSSSIILMPFASSVEAPFEIHFVRMPKLNHIGTGFRGLLFAPLRPPATWALQLPTGICRCGKRRANIVISPSVITAKTMIMARKGQRGRLFRFSFHYHDPFKPESSFSFAPAVPVGKIHPPATWALQRRRASVGVAKVPGSRLLSLPRPAWSSTPLAKDQ